MFQVDAHWHPHMGAGNSGVCLTVARDGGPEFGFLRLLMVFPAEHRPLVCVGGIDGAIAVSARLMLHY